MNSYRRFGTKMWGEYPKLFLEYFLKRYLTLCLYLIVNVVTQAFIGILIFCMGFLGTTFPRSFLDTTLCHVTLRSNEKCSTSVQCHFGYNL